MTDSRVSTYSVPIAGAPNPATLAKATDVAFRVMVRNIGGAPVFIAYDTNSLSQSTPVAGTYLLPPGASDVFVCAPRQGIFAVASGAVGIVSIAISAAIGGDYHA